LASEKSGREKSGIDGIETDGIEGIAGIMSLADLVMLSIRLGAELSSERATLVALINKISMNTVFILIPLAKNVW